ncbi:MAG TPA: adenosylcobinamide-phosphate synthase CbiB [Stellaceae bacterium]|jgi:adenosylcobinamide-phosphate synthase|nr:adenosylcobinamide-phosphate synthase CbiB [Stellaceae bacterium]
MAVELALCALLAELLVGYPDRLVRAIGHPVMWIGSLIAWLDRGLNRSNGSEAMRRAAGVIALMLVLLVVAAVTTSITALTERLGRVGFLIVALVASTLLAQRSLHRHVADVAEALEREGLEGGRRAVAHIVGRDPDTLDSGAVARAAIESLAENFSDGVVAPTLWLAVAGLSGGAAYKAINTADSMIGHHTPRHAAFGWAAARFDDLVNMPASRLSGLLLIAAAAITPDACARGGWHALYRDARHHRSPNAGYPEAAMAGALGLALAGPRVYAGVRVEDAMMGDGRRAATSADIRMALRLYRRADALLILLVGLALLIARG